MKIDRLLQGIGLEGKKKVPSESKAEQEKVELEKAPASKTEDSVRFSQVLEVPEEPEDPAARAEKVQRLASEVSQGTYSISSMLVAEKLLGVA